MEANNRALRSHVPLFWGKTKVRPALRLPIEVIFAPICDQRPRAIFWNLKLVSFNYNNNRGKCMTFAGLWLKNYSVEHLRKHLCCYWLLKFCDTCTRKFESRKTQMGSGTEIHQKIPKVSPCHRFYASLQKKRPSDTVTQTPLKTRGNSLRHPVSASPTQPKPKSPNVLPSSETKCTRFTAKSAPVSVVFFFC